MKFGDEISKLEVLDIKIWVVVGNSLEVVNQPFAGDVI